MTVCLIWSSVWLFIKLGVSDVPPLGFAGMRLLIAVAILLPFTLFRHKSLPKRRSDIVLMAVTGVLLLSVNYGLVYWGTQFISSGLTAVLQASTPLFGLLFAHVWLPRERVSIAKVVGMVLGIGGIGLVFLNQIELAGTMAFLGSFAVVIAAACVAVAYVIVKAKQESMDPTILITGQTIFGLIPLMCFSLIIEGSPLAFNWTSTAIASLIYLAVAGSVAAFWLNYWLLARMDVTKVMVMGIAETLIASLLGVVVLDESYTILTFAGAVCVIFGLWLVLDPSPRNREFA